MKECTTHYRACDCREARAKELEKENAELKDMLQRCLTGSVEYAEKLKNKLEECEAQAAGLRRGLNWICNDASSYGLESEPYVERARKALTDTTAGAKMLKVVQAAREWLDNTGIDKLILLRNTVEELDNEMP